MAELRLKRVVAGCCAVAHEIELGARGELSGVRSPGVEILPHQLAASCAEVGKREDVCFSKGLLDRRIPLISSGQDVIGIDDGGVGRRWSRPKGRRSGQAGTQRERILHGGRIADQNHVLRVRERAHPIGDIRGSEIVKDPATGLENQISARVPSYFEARSEVGFVWMSTLTSWPD